MIAVNRLQQHRNPETRTCGNRFAVRGPQRRGRFQAGLFCLFAGAIQFVT
jgi:hypothetical protein